MRTVPVLIDKELTRKNSSVHFNHATNADGKSTVRCHVIDKASGQSYHYAEGASEELALDAAMAGLATARPPVTENGAALAIQEKNKEIEELKAKLAAATEAPKPVRVNVTAPKINKDN